MSGHPADQKFVRKVCDPHPNAGSHANTKNKLHGDFFFLPVGPMFGRHMHQTLERRISHFFVWQLSMENFIFNISSSKAISSISETHSSLQRAAKKI